MLLFVVFVPFVDSIFCLRIRFLLGCSFSGITLANLRSRTEAFPVELEKAAKETEARIAAKLKTEHQFEKQMLSKDSEAACRLKDQMIASLEAKIQNQEDLIRQLSRKADEAGLSVQNIALKALDSGVTRRPATDVRGDET